MTGDGKTFGYLAIGCLHNAAFRYTVVPNGLDDADLCEIAERAGKGIRTLFDGFNIVLDVTDTYLAKADDIDFAIGRECGVLLAATISFAGRRRFWFPMATGLQPPA